MKITAKNGSIFYIRRIAAAISLCVLLGLSFSYIGFVKSVEVTAAPDSVEMADGVVVLTGDAKRIAQGVKLIEGNHAKRLLISGVGKNTSREDIARSVGFQSLVQACCVDLDYKALDTRGNAQYAERWARLNGFTKLIIVTSDYHMPRAMFLMRQRMPNLKLIPLSIRSDRVSHYSQVLRAFSPLVFREYLKYVAARLGVEPSAKFMISAVSGKTSI